MFGRPGGGDVLAVVGPFQQVESGVGLGGVNDGCSLPHDVAGAQGFAVFDFGGKRPVVRLAKCRLPSALKCCGDCCFRIESQSAGLGKSALMRLGGGACLAIAAPFREIESGVGLGGER